MLNVRVSVKGKCMGFFLFGDTLAVDALAHDIVKVFYRNRAEIHNLDDFDL